MDLYEYQGKRYFARFGIPVGQGAVADTVDEAVAAAETVGYPATIKAQVKVGGRGKAGGVKVVADRSAAEQAARRILGLVIKGHTVRRLWVETATQIAREYYASFTLDPPRASTSPSSRRRGASTSNRSPRRTPRRSNGWRSIRSTGSLPTTLPALVERAGIDAGRRRESSTWSCASIAATSRATPISSRSTRSSSPPR